MTAPLFAIYGAYGHTGRLVAAELLARGRDIVIAGRDGEALATLADELDAARSRPGQVRIRVISIEDAGALRELCVEASVLIHCAGPFSRTGAPVATVAAEASCHYIDHALEPHHIKHVFDTLQGTAQRNGIVMVPGMSFYGGLGDLLASAVTEGLSDVERVVLAYAVSGWRLTTGAKNTAAQLFAETDRLTFADGTLHSGYVEPRNAVFAFPPPLGPRTMIAPFPSFETVTVPRHVPTRNVDLMLTAGTFEEEDVFESESAGPDIRARTDFTIAAQTVSEAGPGAGQLTGSDLWRAAALASVEAAVPLAEGRGPAKTGVLAPAEAFAARPFLRALEALGAFTAVLPDHRTDSATAEPAEPAGTTATTATTANDED
ncbi:saccharopine dehydrogenase NADP-binding domain-containing protein [Streptomyces iconiensis]|uniref:Saccharopine dehydrogenase NADP-binding domain-containing protein n=1 Tax=Streptomyces iconiensis TaxID=1384038 RepID=A0ABT7A123_9ACTN|nr:saccharopine dehydrogenase NADP-binding domain-containing protein [Streptomyces iconiensis]MDJ1135030.1 saccharopine dehydrogenase NADP-binding domain-containing protein [Streptomyces iconiensis]